MFLSATCTFAQSVSPGLTDTEIFDGNLNKGQLQNLTMLQSDDVAKVIVDALSASPTCQVIQPCIIVNHELVGSEL